MLCVTTACFSAESEEAYPQLYGLLRPLPNVQDTIPQRLLKIHISARSNENQLLLQVYITTINHTAEELSAKRNSPTNIPTKTAFTKDLDTTPPRT